MSRLVIDMPEPNDKHHRQNASFRRPAKTYRIAYAEVLNPAQLEAVTWNQGHLLVIAGAGSGKTRTLTYRVARLIEDGVSPHSILLLSFTRKSAQEMIHRATALLDHRCGDVTGGTFHSFACSVLRQHAQRIGLQNNFGILDRADTEDLIGMIRRDWKPSEASRNLPQKGTLATIFSRSVNKGLTLEEVIQEDYPDFGHQIEIINKVWEAYHHRKREHNYCDFDDLLVCLRQLLQGHEDLRCRLKARFENILVDEYQDTNHIQADIISLLAGQTSHVMVVGDDSQSIYAFRGAQFKNIISFPERFPDTHLVKLEENYRSVQPILDVTNAIIENAAEKFCKHLYTQRSEGRMPLLVAAANENIQSRYVADEISRLNRQGIALGDMAVLFRAGFHSFDLEIELARGGIPFVKYGGFKFSESAHVKDFLAHLKILTAPEDRLSWHRALRLIPHVGPKTAQRIFEAVCNATPGREGLPQTVLKKSGAKGLEPLNELIAGVHALTPGMRALGDMVLRYYQPLLQRRYDDHPRRLRDLEQLLVIMERYRQVGPFLADMALEPPNTSFEGRLTTAVDTETRLTLSTIHSAKGLEWHTVFIIWALDGRFPDRRALERYDALEEERRLMYVAATRARDNLIITYPAQVYDRTTNTLLCRPSRFLEDIPEGLLDKHYITAFDI